MTRRIRSYALLFVFAASSCGPGTGSADSPARTGTAQVSEDVLALAASGSPAELRRIGRRGGAGSWYALAVAAERAGYASVARDMRIRSAEHDPHPFGTRSLAALLIEDPRAVSRPLGVLRQTERAAGPDDGLRRARIAVLADKGRTKALVREFGAFAGEPWEAPVLAALAREDPESPVTAAILERYVLHCGDPAALELLPPAAADILDEGYERLLGARKDYAAGRDEDALHGYRAWLESAAGAAECEGEGSPPVYAEMAAAAMRSGKAEEWARLLDDSARAVNCAKRYAAAYEAGKLYRGAGSLRPAAAAFLAAAGAVPPGLERDRAVWYRLRVLYDDPAFAAEEEFSALSWAAGTWSNPERFGDIIEEFLHRRVRSGQWDLLELSYRDWGALWPSSARAEAAWLLAFAAEERRIDVSLPPSAYLEQAAAAAPFSWPGLRAAGLLGTIPPALEGLADDGAGGGEDGNPENTEGVPDLLNGEAEPGPGESAADEEAILSLLLEWGLADAAYDAVMSAPELYSAELIRRTSRALAETDPRRSIRVAGILLQRKDFVPERADLLLIHPLPYGDLAARAAEAEGLPPEVFHGLIRTESAWDADAVSRSGAQGLAQFMPATWEEWVRRLGYPADADPADPETNLRLGAAYLDWLMEREWTYGWVDALASYNAGGGRVRTWRDELPGLGDDLFGASIPVLEPRAYVRKVLSAATLYGYLYEGDPPEVLHRRWGLPMPPMGEEVE